MAQAPRDENRVTALLGTSAVDNTTPVAIWANPTTHELYVTASSSPANPFQVVGNVAHDSSDSGNPVKIGGKAIDLGANPSDVTANDRTNAYFTRAGQMFMIGGHPNIITQNLQITDADGAQTNTAVITVSSGTAIVITMIDCVAQNANTTSVSVRMGFGTSTTPAADAAGVVFFHPGIPPGSGQVRGNGSGIIGIGASNEDLRLTCDDPVGGSISIIVTYFTINIG